MRRLLGTRLTDRPGPRRISARLLILLCLALWIPQYSTANPRGVSSHAAMSRSVDQPAARAVDPPMEAVPRRSQVSPAAANLSPVLDIVPDTNGTDLFISASGMGQLGGTIFANIDEGPGHDKGGYTMTYSDTLQAYVAMATGFTPQVGASGPLNITTTLGLESASVQFNRAYVPASTTQTISSIDGNLQLSLVSEDTIPTDAYLVVVPSFVPPGPAPAGHRFIGSNYSVRASGALLTTDKPMSLRMAYSQATVAGADPHTLAIFAWDAFHRRWDRVGGRVFAQQHYLSVPTSRFTTYALMATTTWQDTFDDFSGLDVAAMDNVTLDLRGADVVLVLSRTPGSGSAVSRSIAPSPSVMRWGMLTLKRTSEPTDTTLRVDVLAKDGTVLFSDAGSGTSLSGIDPVRHPTLKLRARLSSAVAVETPALDEWQVTWEVVEHRVYLPIVTNEP